MKRVFDFYFVPLANVDGVRYGNTLTNLTGSILNGNWKNPNRIYQAEISSLKDLLQEINKDAPISLIINLTAEKEE
jgi:murein tripeptide amidase MpaA